MAQVFGPDTFTVGADTNIDAYPAGDPDYTYATGSGSDLTVNAANDRAQSPQTLVDPAARVSDAGAPTGAQEIIADCSDNGTGAKAGVTTRHATTGNLANYYLHEVDGADVSEVEMWRADDGSFISLAAVDRGLPASATRRLRFRTVLSGASISLEAQPDDTRPVVVGDTAATRKTSGPSGVRISSSVANAVFIDNLSIDDLAATGFMARCGTLSIGTGAAGTTYSAIALGFQPKVVILWWTKRNGNVNAAGDADVSSGFGVLVTTTDRRCIAWQDDHAATTMATDSYHSDAACVATLLTDGTVDGLADLSSLDADGFTLVVDDAFATAISVNYLALGGADLTNMATGVFNEPGATGNHTEGALGFTPGFVMFFSAGIGAAAPGAKVHATPMIGAATSSTQRGVTAISSEDAAADSDTYRYSLSSECIAILEAATGTPDYREDFVSFGSGTFTLNCIERTAGARRVHYLALAGGAYQVGNLLTKTDGTDIAVTGLQNRPRAVFFASHCAAENTANTSVAEAKFSMGAFDSQSAIDPARNRVCRCTKHEDASVAADAGDAMRFDAVYANILVTTAAIDALMDVKSVEATGFTAVMDDVETAASFVWWIAFGDAVAPGGTAPESEDDAFEDDSVPPWILRQRGALGAALLAANPAMGRRGMLGAAGVALADLLRKRKRGGATRGAGRRAFRPRSRRGLHRQPLRTMMGMGR